MSGVGLEDLIEDLIPEIAYSGENGIPVSSLLKIVRQYHASIGGGGNGNALPKGDAPRGPQGADQNAASVEIILSDAEMRSARWAWDWLRSRPQILVNGNKKWNRLDLDEVLALPEAETAEKQAPNAQTKAEMGDTPQPSSAKATLSVRPRIHPAEDLVWQTLTRHGVDYKRVPVLEWKCLLGIASVRAEGILQSDLRRLVDQDKRSLPKRTDSLAKKGYIVKRTIVVQKMKTSKLWLIDFAPPILEKDSGGLDLSPETLTKDLEPVAWHEKWTGNNIDIEALGRTFVAIVKAWGIIKYCDLRAKMGVPGKVWQMKTLAKNVQRVVDMGVLKYTAASFSGSGTRKVFKDCLKFMRDFRDEEWDRFLATGKKTSQYSDATRHREPKPNALVLYGKSEQDKEKKGQRKQRQRRICPGWTPEQPLAQNVFEVLQSSGPEGASNPQVSVATIGYGFRRYMASHLTKVAETQQPPHLKKFQVVSNLVRKGKTSAYMFSVPQAETAPDHDAASQAEGAGDKDKLDEAPVSNEEPPKATVADAYGFGNIRPKVFPSSKNASLSDLCRLARKPHRFGRRKKAFSSQIEKAPEVDASEAPAQDTIPEDLPGSNTAKTTEEDIELPDAGPVRPPKRSFDEMDEEDQAAEEAGPPTSSQDQTPTAPNTVADSMDIEEDPPAETILPASYNGLVGRLELSHTDRVVNFFRRRGRAAKQPIPIHIDKISGSPSIQDATESNGKTLTFVMKESEDANSPKNYVFVFADGEEIQRTAAWIRREVIKLRPHAATSQAASAEPAVATPLESPSRGRGRGRGGRGRGGRRGGRLSSVTVRALKSFKCDTCGGTWKNDIGLKYHQTKAQTPCNPDFTPESVAERALKRRRLSPFPPASTAGSGDEDGMPLSRLRRSRMTKRGERPRRSHLQVRQAMRPKPDVDSGAFRGVGGDKLWETSSANKDPPASLGGGEARSSGLSLVPGSSKPMEVDTPHSPYSEPLATHAQHSLETGSPVAQSTFANGRPAVQLSSSRPDKTAPPHANDTFSERPNNNAPEAQRTPLPPVVDDIQPPLGVEASPYAESVLQTGQPETGKRGNAKSSKLSKKKDKRHEKDENPAAVLPVAEEQAAIKPFEPTTDYERMSTESKRRIAQAYDIINYLLDNSSGVFPGDKALFYAVTKVFLKEFRNQVPPTWKSYFSAVKALEARKVATVHTHMLRTERGKLLTCSLLMRTGVDPTGSIPTMMKRKMRDMWPNVYIPAAFSPTQEELALLQDLDKKPASLQKEEKEDKPNANGQKFRSRRKIDEIEVFNAPYYTQNASNNNNTNNAIQPMDPLWIRESEQLQKEGPDNRKRSILDELEGSPVSKRQKTDGLDALPIDPELETQAYNQFSEEPPSVIDAIKTYGLLPSRPGKRGGPKPTTGRFGKLPARLGRLRNPGLDSLPSFFGRFSISKEPVSAAQPQIQFLEPNTQLEDAEMSVEDERFFSGDGGYGSRPGSSSSMAPLPASTPVSEQEPQREPENGDEQTPKFVFVPPIVIKSSQDGSWSKLGTGYFRGGEEASFTMEGWMPDRHLQLLQNLPTSAEDMASRSKQSHFNPSSWVDHEWGSYYALVHRCATWEQSETGAAILSGGSVAPDYTFINFSSSESKASMKPIVGKWSDEREFGLDTLPYDDLDEDDDLCGIGYCAEVIGDANPRPAKKPRIPGQRKMGRPQKFKLQAIKTGRELSAYPKSADDFLRDPEKEKDDIDWTSENTRLAAFVVVTTLLGGVDRVVDWGLMMRLFPDLTLSQLRHLWGLLRKDRQSTIVNLTDKFRKAFLKAYSDNEIPPLDFDNPLAYDWKRLIRWTINLHEVERTSLPASRKALVRQFDVSSCKYTNREWREAYYHMQRSVFNKFQDATSEALAYPVDGNTKPALDTNLTVAMSWTRALCVTPVDTYTTEGIIHKRNTLYPGLSKTEITDLILKGVDQLQHDGVISKSTSKWSNGRRWRFNHRVLETLEKISHVDKVGKAVAFKNELDKAFRAGETKRVTYVTNDGMIMALLNMQACGRIRVETTGQPNVPLGHEPLNYETRKYTKKYMHFRIDIVPTDTYLYNNDPEFVQMRDRIRNTAPPTAGPGGAIPAWCDVFGKVDTSRWLKYLSAALVTLAARGSMRAEELVKTLKPTTMLFEAELILGWGEKLGLLQSQLHGSTALACMEWWWIALEAQKEGLERPKPRKALPTGRRKALEDEAEQ
ncbi:hypothetical protein B0T24DRAFT_553652 [Lasiosphaeria ovina]|uniref:Uncharacterized protein n=1 Tax=Lasiosphaeria ovina TaxID=92902 RepID=A0AAE0N7U8_9PEZI|nr:hypothetical protein B0T24DRAFT_553652 [Lasiosphaeria ovina]